MLIGFSDSESAGASKIEIGAKVLITGYVAVSKGVKTIGNGWVETAPGVGSDRRRKGIRPRNHCAVEKLRGAVD